MKISNLLLKSVLGAILILSFNATSQQQYTLKCTMNQREIIQNQPFNEDAVEAESARELFNNFINTLNLSYYNINNGLSQELQNQQLIINTSIQSFQTLGLNYSMFNEDIEFILNYN